MLNGLKVTVIMPAYNAGKTLKVTYDALPKELVDDIILTDDKSSDSTSESPRVSESIPSSTRRTAATAATRRHATTLHSIAVPTSSSCCIPIISTRPDWF